MKNKYSWSYLIHLSTNMWMDRDPADFETDYRKVRCLSPKRLFDENVYLEWTGRMNELGMDMAILDVGDAVCFPSHPELAIEGSWTPDRMRAEVRRLKTLGIEAIPKLNFSTGHDSWLKDYHRMVSTPAYYRVCEDLIRDVAEMFDHPRFLHLGYDEESPNQGSNFAVARQGELWWHDYLWFISAVEKAGMRAWSWADAAWGRDEEFCRRCPKSVLLSNWYYGKSFTERDRAANTYRALEKAGFDQVPTGSNWGCPENMGLTVDFCREVIAPERLKGFMMATWARTLPRYRAMGARSFDILAETIARVERGEILDVNPEVMWVVKDGQIDRWQYPGDRFNLYPGETLVVDNNRVGRYRPAIDLDNAAKDGVKLTVRPAKALKGLLAADETPSQTVEVEKRERRRVLSSAEYRYLAVSADDRVCLTRVFSRGA